MYSVVLTAMIQGIKSVPVSVEADVSDGLPLFEMVGFLASEVKEAKERVRTALRNIGFTLPPKRITINVLPANIRKNGSGFDLPVALAILAAVGIIPKEAIADSLVIGEVSLNGEIKPVSGILPVVAGAKEKGIKACIVPGKNAAEARLVKQMRIYAVDSLTEVIRILNGGDYVEKDEKVNREKRTELQPDFSEIHGQKVLKRACETAACGMHNLLIIGPPGAGKTMAAMRMPGILPPLDEEEQMELSKIYSVCGRFESRVHLMEERPFRCPHHTVTAQGLSGGGRIPGPGEVSLAHKGILFLDELPEFQQSALEILRQPMEEGTVRIVRVGGTCEYPADFMLIAAMNPCKCGYFPDIERCRCTASSMERYINRISQPLLDRIDLCTFAPQIKFEELTETAKEETSEQIRARVILAHERQRYRFRNENFRYNSQIPSQKIAEFCRLNDKQEKNMEQIFHRFHLTARSYHKILKAARTIADMDGSDKIENRHLNEAVCYRNINRHFWERK